MKSSYCCGLVTLTVLLLVGGSVSQAQTGSHDKALFENQKARILSKIRQDWSDQIQQAHTLEDSTKANLTGSDGQIVIHGGYTVTHPDNPLIDQGCRTESLAEALMHLKTAKNVDEDQAFAMADRHIREEQKKYNKGATFSDWLKHVAECKDFCNVAVLRLLQCHVEAVAKHDRSLVLFDFNSALLDTGEDDNKIQAVVNKLQQDGERQVLLIGRASRTGNAIYNRQLSQSRVDAVRQQLEARAISASRIKLQALGYEEPQLNQWISQVYGISDIYSQLGDKGINQSVLVVLY